jgi:hypothetical protein
LAAKLPPRERRRAGPLPGACVAAVFAANLPKSDANLADLATVTKPSAARGSVLVCGLADGEMMARCLDRGEELRIRLPALGNFAEVAREGLHAGNLSSAAYGTAHSTRPQFEFPAVLITKKQQISDQAGRDPGNVG